MDKEQVITRVKNVLHEANNTLSPTEFAKLIYEVYKAGSVLISNAIVMEIVK